MSVLPKTEEQPVEKIAAPSHTKTYLWLVTVPMVWSFNFVVLKLLYGEPANFTVLGLLSSRYILMVPLLAVLLLLTEKDRWIRREHWGYLAVFSLITVGIYQYLFAKAIELTSAGEAALLISTAPIFTIIIMAVLGWERMTRRGLAGVFLGFVGVSMVIYGGQGAANIPDTHIIGDLVMIAAAILWAAYAIFSKPLLQHYSPLKVTAWAHILGAVILIPVGWNQMLQVDWVNLTWDSWLYVLYFGWLAGVYGFVVWYRGVRVLGSAKTMLFQYLVPPLALLVAFFVIDEVPSWLQIVGIVVTLSGVHVASRSRIVGK